MALRKQKSGFSPLSYDPVRACSLDILNAQNPLLGPSPDTPLAEVERAVAKASRSEDERESNLVVARLLHHFVRAEGMLVTHVDHGTFATRIGDSVAYWVNAVVQHNDQLLIPFNDFRRTSGLTEDGRRFAASVMHLRVREQNRDLASARLAVFQFPYHRNERSIRMTVVPEVDLYGPEALASMIAETYELWGEVLEEQAYEARRNGTSGTLL
jgi:hypothetical protein